jgi:hypothetical protein
MKLLHHMLHTAPVLIIYTLHIEHTVQLYHTHCNKQSLYYENLHSCAHIGTGESYDIQCHLMKKNLYIHTTYTK